MQRAQRQSTSIGFRHIRGVLSRRVDTFGDQMIDSRLSAFFGEVLVVAVIAPAVCMRAHLDRDIRVEVRLYQVIEGGYVRPMSLIKIVVNIF